MEQLSFFRPTGSDRGTAAVESNSAPRASEDAIPDDGLELVVAVTASEYPGPHAPTPAPQSPARLEAKAGPEATFSDPVLDLESFSFPDRASLETPGGFSSPSREVRGGRSLPATTERETMNRKENEKETRNPVHAVLGELLPAPVTNAIARTFARMEIAEDEIGRACRETPDAEERIERAFGALVPTASLRELSDELYRGHCREILARAAQGSDLRPGTRAEILATLSAASLSAPPTPVAFLLYQELFAVLFPEHLEANFPAIDGYEADEVRALESKLRRKLSVPNRALRDQVAEVEPAYGSRAPDLAQVEITLPERLETTFVREVSVRYVGPARKASPIRRPEDAVALARKLLHDDAREHFLAIYLDGRHRPIAHSVVSIGTATASLVHPREVFQPALLVGAVSLAILHNHPSGDVSPSPEDRAITERLAKAGTLLGIRLLDSIVFERSGSYHSFSEATPSLLEENDRRSRDM